MCVIPYCPALAKRKVRAIWPLLGQRYSNGSVVDVTELENQLELAVQVEPEFPPQEIAGSLHCRRWGTEV
jgi:hypothetical protein